MSPFSPESIAARSRKRTAVPRTAGPVAPVPITSRPRRPGPAPAGAGRASRAARAARVDGAVATRDLVFTAAAAAFSRDGFDGVGVDDIARAAGVNKAMIYYHFKDKLALYREVVRDMLRAVNELAAAIAAGDDTPTRKIERFVETIANQRDQRPWFPPLMLREWAAGAPRLDAETLGLMRGVFTAFADIVNAGVADGTFRRVNPLLAYMTILAPLMMNAARERAAEQPGRANLPMFAAITRHDLIAHMQRTALGMLATEPTP